MKPLFGVGKEFNALVEDSGVRIYDGDENVLIEWCHWLGAIDLLCRRVVEDKPCVEVEAKETTGKDTIEGSAKFVCVCPSSAAIWIATILVNLDLASACHDTPQSIALTADGKRILFSLLKSRESFSKNLAKVLRDMENSLLDCLTG